MKGPDAASSHLSPLSCVILVHADSGRLNLSLHFISRNSISAIPVPSITFLPLSLSVSFTRFEEIEQTRLANHFNTNSFSQQLKLHTFVIIIGPRRFSSSIASCHQITYTWANYTLIFSDPELDIFHTLSHLMFPFTHETLHFTLKYLYSSRVRCPIFNNILLIH